MSDDEGLDEGEYDDLEPGLEDLGEEAATTAPPEDDSDDAGSEIEADDGVVDTDDDADEPVVSQKAHPQRVRVDPVIRASNRQHTIRLVPDEERTTDNRLHKSEAALVIAKRAEQIARHATHFAEKAAGLHDPVAIAYRELYERRCPLRLRRRVGYAPNGDELVEEWSVREMTLPPLQLPRSFTGAAAEAK
jgi:DNA-directed RNA polymerase subunit K/omega